MHAQASYVRDARLQLLHLLTALRLHVRRPCPRGRHEQGVRRDRPGGLGLWDRGGVHDHGDVGILVRGVPQPGVQTRAAGGGVPAVPVQIQMARRHQVAGLAALSHRSLEPGQGAEFIGAVIARQDATLGDPGPWRFPGVDGDDATGCVAVQHRRRTADDLDPAGGRQVQVRQRGLAVRQGQGDAVHQDAHAPDAERCPGAQTTGRDAGAQGQVVPIVRLQPRDHGQRLVQAQGGSAAADPRAGDFGHGERCRFGLQPAPGHGGFQGRQLVQRHGVGYRGGSRRVGFLGGDGRGSEEGGARQPAGDNEDTPDNVPGVPCERVVHQSTNSMTRNPPTSRRKNAQTSRSKYRSMKPWMRGPNT